MEGRVIHIGQYWKIVNLDKKEVLVPHDFGDGSKLKEFAFSSMGTMTALALLLSRSDGVGGGGGDFGVRHGLIGSWVGDRIVITGDYDSVGNYAGYKDKTLYEAAEEFNNISSKVLKVMLSESSLAIKLKEASKTNYLLFEAIEKAVTCKDVKAEKVVIKEEKRKPPKVVKAPDIVKQYEGMDV